MHGNCSGSKVGRGHKLNLILLPLILNFIGNYSLILLLGIKNKLLALIIIKSHQQIEQAKFWFQLNFQHNNNAWKEFVGNCNGINSWIIIENERSFWRKSRILMWAMHAHIHAWCSRGSTMLLMTMDGYERGEI